MGITDNFPTNLTGPGSLGSVCVKYFDIPKHQGCPFQNICLAGNGHPRKTASISIVRSVTSEQLRKMADCIDTIKLTQEKQGGKDGN